MYEVPAIERKGFTNELWCSISSIYNEILTHPFLRGLTDGTRSTSRAKLRICRNFLWRARQDSNLRPSDS